MAVGIQLLSADGVTPLTIDNTHNAARINGRPMELGTRGAYSLAANSGVMAAGLAANSEIFQFRWVNNTLKCLVRSIMCSGGGIAAFAAGFGKFEAIIRRSYTTDGSGGTAIVFSTNNTNKRRTDFSYSALSDTGIRIASTAALTGGTGNLDTNAFAGVGFGVTATAGATLGVVGVPIWQRNTHDEYPLLLEQNEGFVIRATVPATGTWTFEVAVEWAEIDPSEVTGWA